MKISEKVAQILSTSRTARNSDRALLIEYMQGEGMQLTPHQIQVFLGMGCLETVRRNRQTLQAKGMYKADQGVKKARDIKAQEMQQNMPKKRPEDIERILEDDTPGKAVYVGLDQ